MEKIKSKIEKTKIALFDEKKRRNFEINKLNLQQKSIFKSIVNILDNDKNFITNIKSYMRYSLSKKDLLDLYKEKNSKNIIVDLTNFNEVIKKNIKEKLVNKEITLNQIKKIKPYYSNEYNMNLLKELKKINNTFKDNNKKIISDYFKENLEINNINISFYREIYYEEVEQIFKLEITKEHKILLIEFCETYISDRIMLEEKEQLLIKRFVINNRFYNTILYIYFLLCLGYLYQDIMNFIIDCEEYFDVDVTKKYAQIRLNTINKSLKKLEENYNESQKNIAKMSIDDMLHLK